MTMHLLIHVVCDENIEKLRFLLQFWWWERKKLNWIFHQSVVVKVFFFAIYILWNVELPYIIKKRRNSSRIIRQECLKNLATFEKKLNWIFHQGKEKPQKETFLCFYPCLYKAKRIILCDRRCLICKCSQP